MRDHQSTTYVGGFEATPDFGIRLRADARRRGLGRAAKVVFIGDGTAWIWELERGNFPRAILILDLYHALDRLHELCDGLYGKDTPWAGRMKLTWTALLKADQVREVIAAARRRREDLGRPPEDELAKQIAYFGRGPETSRTELKNRRRSCQKRQRPENSAVSRLQTANLVPPSVDQKSFSQPSGRLPLSPDPTPRPKSDGLLGASKDKSESGDHTRVSAIGRKPDWWPVGLIAFIKPVRIPTQIGHPLRFKSDRQYDSYRTPVTIEIGQGFRSQIGQFSGRS